MTTDAPREKRIKVRDSERTRRQLLDATEDAIVNEGAGVSLATIAKLAGTSKSTLLHHFGNRDELVAAVVKRSVERFWGEVMACADLGEHRPGTFTRAYVRALTGDSAYVQESFSPTGLLATLGADYAQEQFPLVAPDDADRLNEAFATDGLPLPLAWSIRYAAEGLAGSFGSPYLTEEQMRLTREHLLAMTEI